MNNLSSLLTLSEKSPLDMKHSSYLMKGRKIVGSGYNQIKGNKSWHAEVSAVFSYLISSGTSKYLKCRLHR